MKYISGILVLFIIAFFIFGTFSSKKKAYSQRISCHDEMTVFERVIDKSNIKNLQNIIKNGEFDVSIKPLPSKFMKTKMFEKLNPQDVSKDFLKLFKISNSKKAHVHIDIYENDKKDPKKKSKKAFSYEGYLYFIFSIQNKEIYKIQLDFYEPYGKDIPQVLQCAKESILTLEEK